MMNDRFKFRIPMFTDKGTFMEFQYVELGDEIECSLCGYNGKPQQSTGLYDKNGKLVYEGDVVIYKGNLKVVVFDEINLCHCLLWAKHYNPQWKSSTSGLKYDKVTKTKKLEVVDNIYENKELLDEQFRKTVL